MSCTLRAALRSLRRSCALRRHRQGPSHAAYDNPTSLALLCSQLFDLDGEIAQLSERDLLSTRSAGAAAEHRSPGSRPRGTGASGGGDGGKALVEAFMHVMSADEVAGLVDGQVVDLARRPDWGTVAGAVLLGRSDGKLYFATIGEPHAAAPADEEHLRIVCVCVCVCVCVRACAHVSLREHVHAGSRTSKAVCHAFTNV